MTSHASSFLPPDPYSSAFAAALLNSGWPLPDGIADQSGAAARDRFAVYRNNVVQGLVAALETRFAAVRRGVGEEFFAAAARRYAFEHPPQQPIMAFYGEGFPDFLEGFAPCAELPYLADLARLEAARTRAYHAEDAEPLTADAFAGIAQDDLMDLRLRLHPSLFVLASRHPIATIFAMNMGELPVREIADWRGEEICIVRPRMRVEVYRLPSGGTAFLTALARAATLAQAAALAASPDFDLTENLAGLIRCGLVAAIAAPRPSDHERITTCLFSA